MEYQFGTPVQMGDYDVAVVGGGIAGVAAALAAAREGMNVVLFEKLAALGGLATVGLINWFEPLCDGKGKKLIGGICEEMLWESIRYGGDDLPADWREKGSSDEKSRRYTTHYSPNIFAVALTGMLLDAGVKIRFDSLATYPQGENGRVRGLLCETKTGCEFYGCRVLIDASGDADMFDRFGCSCETGLNYMSYTSHYCDFGNMKAPSMLSMRRWKLTGATMTGENQPEDVPFLEGVTSDDVNAYLLAGQKRLLEFLKSRDRLSGELTGLPMMAQFRTTRHIVSAYDITEADMYCHFEDSVGAFADFRPSRRGQWYEIPYRSLYSPECRNMLAAGRVTGAKGETWKATRVVPVCALTGEIAGRAAAIAVKANVDVENVDVALLRERMTAAGNFVDYDRD